jgi:hypothetical protein
MTAKKLSGLASSPLMLAGVRHPSQPNVDSALGASSKRILRAVESRLISRILQDYPYKFRLSELAKRGLLSSHSQFGNQFDSFAKGLMT